MSTTAPSAPITALKGAPVSPSDCRPARRRRYMPTLLIVDDEPSIRYSFQRAFEGNGTTVRTAPTAAEGLQIVREDPPDVVVLDLQLPDRSGLELFAELHEEHPRLPVIFITAHGTTETAI